MDNQQTVLGLDLGPNSIGWALLNAKFEGAAQVEESGLIAAGVRVFEEGVSNFDTSKEKSLSQERRIARSARRRQRRLNDRKKKLRQLLQTHGLLPSDSDELDALLKTDPYELRAKALDGKLTPHQIGRALYHLNQRRGFKSNAKTDRTEKKTGEVKEGIDETRKAMSDRNCRTLGEFFYKLSQELDENGRPKLLTGKSRIRDRYTQRDMFESEFDTIWAEQSKHHPDILTEDLRTTLRDKTIFYQRSYLLTPERLENAPSRANLWRSPQISKCPFFPEEEVLARGHWLAQEFRIWKEINNLAIYSVDHGGRRQLTKEEREHLAGLLSLAKDRKFDQFRKDLNALQKSVKDTTKAPGIGDPDHERFNLEEGGRTKLNGNTVENTLANAIGKKKWAKIDEDEKQRLRLALSRIAIEETDPDKIQKCLVATFVGYDLDAKAKDKLARFDAGDKYMGYSRKAIEKILPFLREGQNEWEAIESAGLGRGDNRKQEDKLPVQALINAGIPNPVVNRCLFELRKVVNAIVRKYGKPTYIRVELAREMHGGKEARSERSKHMNKRNKEREAVKEEVAKMNVAPNRDNILRYELWKEQNETCPYTGEKIGQSQIFGNQTQVDHIRPRWRSLDDSRMNKVLCHNQANRDKGNKTPFEWLGGKPEFDRMLQTVKSMKNMPARKQTRFAEKEMPTDGFVSRQLNDTSYIAREAVAYLKLLYPPEMRDGEKTVGTARGGLTAELRRQWGLNRILSKVVDGKGEELKTREDHRHHAVDAIVVALSTRRNLKRYSDYWKKRDPRTEAEHDKNRPVFEAPWGTPDTFRGEVAGIVDNINVSHRVQGKIRGGFHEATYFGKTSEENTYVFRASLDDEVSYKDLDNIRDETVKDAVFKHLRSKGWKHGDKKVPKGAFETFPTMDSGNPIKRVRVTRTMNQPLGFKANGEDFRFAQVGNNHHVEFAMVPTKDGKKELRCRVVDTLTVAKNVRQRKLPLVGNDLSEGAELVMSLTRKDSVLATDPETGKQHLCIVQMMSGNPTFSTGMDITLRDVKDSRPASEGNKSPFKRFQSVKAWKEYQIKKVRVSPLGEVEKI